MTEKQAIEAIHALPRLQGAPTLERMRALLAELGNPEKTSSASTLRAQTAKGRWQP